MKVNDLNPFLRVCEIQQSMLQGNVLRKAYDYRLFYVLNGKGTVVTDEKSIKLEENSLIILDDTVGYKFVGDMKTFVLNFDVTQKSSGNKKPRPPANLPFYREELRFNPDKLDELEPFNLFNSAETVLPTLYEMLREFNSINPYREAMCSALLKSVIITLLTQSTLGTDTEAIIVNKVNAIIKTDISEVKNISTVATKLGYHPVYIATIYKNKTGENLHSVITDERIKLACKFLKNTSNSVENIALSTGFASRSHFCTAFKKAKNTSPLAYRKRANKN